MLQVFSLVEMLGEVEGQGVMREAAGRSAEAPVRGCVWPAASSAAPRPQGACAGPGARRQGAPSREAGCV